MSEALKLTRGEQYHVDRESELGLSYGTGKRYDRADIERFMEESGEEHESIHLKPMVRAFFFRQMSRLAEQGVDLDNPEIGLAATASVLHGMAYRIYNPEPHLPNISYDHLSSSPREAFDIVLGLLGEATAEAEVSSNASEINLNIQEKDRQEILKYLTAEHSKTYRDIAKLYDLYDPQKVADRMQEIQSSF